MTAPDPTPEPSAASEGSAPAAGGGRRRLRRLGCLLLALVVLAPLGLVLTAAVVLRHVPYAIPERDRAPAPPAGAAGGLRLRWLGVSGYAVSDGETVLVLDPMAHRPRVWGLVSGPLEPDPEAAAALAPEADYVLVNHAHYDHAVDAPALARATGATLVGSRSATNLGRSRGVPEERLITVAGGERLELGAFTVTVHRARHTDLFGLEGVMTGTIPADAGDLWFFEYVQDATLAYRLEGGGASVWFHPTSTYAEGELGGLPAETLILGVAGEPLTTERARGILSEARPRRVLPTHYDNFFQPREAGLGLLPSVDLEAARAAVLEADPQVAWWVLDHGQEVHLPPDGGGP